MSMKHIAAAVVAVAGVSTALPAAAAPHSSGISASSIVLDEFGKPKVNGQDISALIADVAISPDRLAGNNCNCSPPSA